MNVYPVSFNTETIQPEDLFGIQRDFHLVQSGPIDSHFLFELNPISWYARTVVVLTAQTSTRGQLHSEKGGQDVIVYKIDQHYHCLTYVVAVDHLPRVEIDPAYQDSLRIRWCHNAGINRIRWAKLIIDDIRITGFDSFWGDVHYNRMLDYGRQQGLKPEIGNVPELNQWTTELPRSRLRLPQPWSYSDHPDRSIRLHFASSLSKVKHEYSFRNRVFDLIQISQKVGDEWVMLKRNQFPSVREGLIMEKEELPAPQMYAGVTNLGHNEASTIGCDNYMKSVYIRDVETVGAGNIVITPDGDKSMQLNSPNPVIGVYWAAQSLEGLERNIFSRYTTSPDDARCRESPATSFELAHRTKIHASGDDVVSDLIEWFYHYDTPPIDSGHHSFSVMFRPKSHNLGPSFLPSKLNSTLTVTTLPGNYQTLVRLLVIKRYDFVYVPAKGKFKWVLHKPKSDTKET